MYSSRKRTDIWKHAAPAFMFPISLITKVLLTGRKQIYLSSSVFVNSNTLQGQIFWRWKDWYLVQKKGKMQDRTEVVCKQTSSAAQWKTQIFITCVIYYQFDGFNKIFKYTFWDISANRLFPRKMMGLFSLVNRLFPGWFPLNQMRCKHASKHINVSSAASVKTYALNSSVPAFFEFVCFGGMNGGLNLVIMGLGELC